MGASGSYNEIVPELVLGGAEDDVQHMACNGRSVLFLYSTKIVKIINFDGSMFTRELRLQPTCCCAASNGGWVIGFKTGQITEFSENLTVLFSYHLPGGCRAHNTEVTHVRENADYYSKKCHLISVANDGTCHLWTSQGLLLYAFTSSTSFTSINSSPFFAFLGEASGKVHAVSVESLSTTSFQLPAPAICIEPVGEGFGFLAVLKDGRVAICSATDIVDIFEWKEENPVASVLPLAVEEGTGLITYAAVNTEGEMTLRALDEIIEDVGIVSHKFCFSEDKLVTSVSDKTVVYSLDKIRYQSILNLPDLGLPRTEISRFLLRQ